MGDHLRRAGVEGPIPEEWGRAAGATVVGTRAAAWAPVAGLAAVVVVDEHDESHRQEQAPTWHARDVAAERPGAPACPACSHRPARRSRRWAGAG